MKRQKGKKKGQAKERVFGCDLVTHLEGSGQDVPQVLKLCAEFIEQHGVVDGIYRLSGISSNIQKLRQEFDTEKTVDLSKEVYLQDIHCVSSLCKAYFRELPNPLLMYRLYDKFADAVNTQLEAERLLKIRHVLQELPPSHYRTLEYLMQHLLRMASCSPQTNMHARNLAIVWAPNLLRSKEIEMSGFNGTAAFMEVRVQSIVVEFILNHVQHLFGSGDWHTDSDGDSERCQSLPCLSPGWEQAPGRTHPSQIPRILHLGDGPPAMRPYHSIIELPESRRKGSLKVKKWRSIFNLGRSGNDAKRKVCRNEEKDPKTSSLTLRPAKSMDSLSSAPYTNDGSPTHGAGRGTLSRRESLSSGSLDPAFLLPPEQVGRPVLRGSPDSPRSAKEARERAGRRVALHISGPFSVSLPSHVTPLLHRPHGGQTAATCPTQGPPPPTEQSAHRAQETENTAEDEEDEEGEEEEMEQGGEDEESLKLPLPTALALPLPEISLELQDTFSFLDNQEMGDCDLEYPGELGQPLRTPEEMDPSEYDPAASAGGLGGVDMSIESELMEREMDEGELPTYTQLHLQEFSVEPPCEEDWGPDQDQPHCWTPPRVEEDISEEEEPGDPSAQSGAEDNPTAGGTDGQDDPNEPAAGPGSPGCEGTTAGFEEPLVGSAGPDGWGTGDPSVEAAATGVPEGADAGVGRQPTAAPMRLESRVVPCLQARALPVVPPKPHYAILPPALKARPRPAADHPPLSPVARSAAWRKAGSQSFDEAVARRRDQQGLAASSRPHLRPFVRGDSLPSPRDRLSLPPGAPLSRATGPGSPTPPRCRSLALEAEAPE
ncbi:rho GTPase-activating protein 30-like [Leucoraja erinacea]|uniref:rho GTPase-activating protein 30-like n=1 Tax=Leucoraja erinaceus TaxID=7782 RepID=UPI002458F3FC|nr:rho GTPase-activating protein 30-like [Leucoraja erinacea]